MKTVVLSSVNRSSTLISPLSPENPRIPVQISTSCSTKVANNTGLVVVSSYLAGSLIFVIIILFSLIIEVPFPLVSIVSDSKYLPM